MLISNYKGSCVMVKGSAPFHTYQCTTNNEAKRSLKGGFIILNYLAFSQVLNSLSYSSAGVSVITVWLSTLRARHTWRDLHVPVGDSYLIRLQATPCLILLATAEHWVRSPAGLSHTDREDLHGQQIPWLLKQAAKIRKKQKGSANSQLTRGPW